MQFEDIATGGRGKHEQHTTGWDGDGLGGNQQQYPRHDHNPSDAGASIIRRSVAAATAGMPWLRQVLALPGQLFHEPFFFKAALVLLLFMQVVATSILGAGVWAVVGVIKGLPVAAKGKAGSL